jgi:hypothetical protein
MILHETLPLVARPFRRASGRETLRRSQMFPVMPSLSPLRRRRPPALNPRACDAVVVVATSIKARGNPVRMTLWGRIVAGALLIGSLPFFASVS